MKVLFIDDDIQAHKTMRLVMPELWRITSAYSGEHGLELLDRELPDVIILDINLPAKNGLEILDLVRQRRPAPPVIMLSAVADTAAVVRAIQSGAHDYLVKPFDAKKLEGTVLAAVRNAGRDLPQPTGPDPLEKMVGGSACLAQVKILVRRLAGGHANVLIRGASGTGKELVARALHDLSPRAAGSFVALNCAAIPLTLLESELFGSEKGAFTDARTRTGSFERASGGTLFLDEIGDMPLEAQAKLLRALEEKSITRVGGTEPIPVDVRIVAATHRDLQSLAAEKKFREDLYYRISVLPVDLPPLRERGDDVYLIALHLLSRADTAKRLTPEARSKLEAHDWPGNVRELANTIERALVYAEGDAIRAADIVF